MWIDNDIGTNAFARVGHISLGQNVAARTLLSMTTRKLVTNDGGTQRTCRYFGKLVPIRIAMHIVALYKGRVQRIATKQLASIFKQNGCIRQRVDLSTGWILFNSLDGGYFSHENVPGFDFGMFRYQSIDIQVSIVGHFHAFGFGLFGTAPNFFRICFVVGFVTVGVVQRKQRHAPVDRTLVNQD